MRFHIVCACGRSVVAEPYLDRRSHVSLVERTAGADGASADVRRSDSTENDLEHFLAAKVEQADRALHKFPRLDRITTLAC